MSDRRIELKLRINFPVIFFAVLAIHAVLFGVKKLDQFTSNRPQSRDRERKNNTPLKIREIRTIGSRDSKRRDSVYVAKTPGEVKTISTDMWRPATPPSPQMKSPPTKRPMSLADLQDNRPVIAKKTVRPGTRPEVAKASDTTKTLSAISLKGEQIHKFAQSENAATLSGDPRAATLSNSDILVNLEVPEGVNPDELNKYELMFYGFQRRTAIGYINSFYKHLDKFQRENPHKNFPLTETKQVMTGRLTYDKAGNITQIKMVRWSNVDQLQDFFVDVLKDMDTLHNPPQALWEKNGEFSIFFSLVING
ncbi:MAG: hypothetical protein V4598_10365 [Bdellovibrionota bacterium]